MLIEAARRAEAAAKEMLALVTEGSASCAEILDALTVSKALAGINSAFQVAGAAAVAGRERHGDGGAEVLASSAGLSRREAHSQVKTAETLRNTPRLRDAVESGRVSVANAKRLAEAVGKTSADDVEADSDLLAKAESMRPEQFTKEARRWVTDRDGDGGAAEHARQRARRCVRMWDADDGLVHLHGQFDTVTGERIRNRLRAEAASMYDGDKKNATNGGADRRTFDQCMADALDSLTADGARTSGGTGSGGAKPIADICVIAHVDDATGELIAKTPAGDRLPRQVLEELACNAAITPTIYNRRGVLLWRGHSKRTATATQLRTLRGHLRRLLSLRIRLRQVSGPPRRNRHLGVGPPTLTTWCRPAGAATTRSITSLAYPRPARQTHNASTRPVTYGPAHAMDPPGSGLGTAEPSPATAGTRLFALT